MTGWVFTDDGAQKYTVDSVDISEGETLFKRGQEITLQCVFHEDSGGEFHIETYNRLLEKYKRYLSDDAVKTTISSRGVPKYTQNLNPLSGASSYLFKLEPSSDLDYQDSWWVVVTEISDETVIRGPVERLDITLLPLVPVDGTTRTEIVNKYEV